MHHFETGNVLPTISFIVVLKGGKIRWANGVMLLGEVLKPVAGVNTDNI